MSTKAQLEQRLEDRYNDYVIVERKLQGRINDLEKEANDREFELEKAKAYLRPFFVPRTAGPIPLDEGTAHCPVCNACAPGTLKIPPNEIALVVTARPIKHREGCYFAEQCEADPPELSNMQTLHDPDGQEVTVDLRDIVIMMDSIQYTTLMVKQGIKVYRVAVCEKKQDLRDRRTAAYKKEGANTP